MLIDSEVKFIVPIKEIKNPETGIKIKTKMVSLELIKNIEMIVNIIINGSLTISSNIDKKEC